MRFLLIRICLMRFFTSFSYALGILLYPLLKIFLLLSPWFFFSAWGWVGGSSGNFYEEALIDPFVLSFTVSSYRVH